MEIGYGRDVEGGQQEKEKSPGLGTQSIEGLTTLVTPVCE